MHHMDYRPKRMAHQLQKFGQGSDIVLAHLNPHEAEELRRTYGMSINPITGLPQFGKFGPSSFDPHAAVEENKELAERMAAEQEAARQSHAARAEKRHHDFLINWAHSKGMDIPPPGPEFNKHMEELRGAFTEENERLLQQMRREEEEEGSGIEKFIAGALPIIGGLVGGAVLGPVGAMIGGSIGGAHEAMTQDKPILQNAVKGAGLATITSIAAPALGSVLKVPETSVAGKILGMQGPTAHTLQNIVSPILGTNAATTPATAAITAPVAAAKALSPVVAAQTVSPALSGITSYAAPTALAATIGKALTPSHTRATPGILGQNANIMGTLGTPRATGLMQTLFGPAPTPTQQSRAIDAPFGGLLSGLINDPMDLALIGTAIVGNILNKEKPPKEESLEEMLGKTHGGRSTEPEKRAKPLRRKVRKTSEPFISKGSYFEEVNPEVEYYAPGEIIPGFKKGGIIRGRSGGQDDNRKVTIPEGSYVMDATTVSLLGDGNTENGIKKIKEFESKFHRSGIYREGGPARQIKARLSDGEQFITPKAVTAIGRGNHAKGVHALDRMRNNLRHQKGVKKFLPPKSKPIESYIR